MKNIKNMNQSTGRNKSRARLLYGFAILTSVIALASAWYLQHVKLLAPCPFCIVERYAFALLLLFGIWGVVKQSLPKWMDVLGFAVALVGVGVSGYLLYKLSFPSLGCGIDPVANAVNDIPLASWFPGMFRSYGACSADLPSILGVTIPQWGFLFLLAQTLIWFRAMTSKQKSSF